MTAKSKPYILAIDPGNEQSAFCLCSPNLKPLHFGKYRNRHGDEFIKELISAIKEENLRASDMVIVIENIESFGMPVGRTVLDTCIYIGELKREFEGRGYPVEYVFRHEEKMAICHSPKANDATIKQALIDRFAPNTSNYGKGNKKSPGFFYGFKADCWSAFAQAVTYHDKHFYGDLHLEELPF